MNYSSQNDMSVCSGAGAPQDAFVESLITSISRVAGVVVLVAGFIGIATVILL